MKTTLFLGFGVLFWVSGAPTRIQTLKKVRWGELVGELRESANGSNYFSSMLWFTLTANWSMGSS